MQISAGRCARAVCGVVAGLWYATALAPATAQQHTVKVWVTSADASKRLSPQPEVAFSPDAPGGDLTIDVDASRTYQQVLGFGASMTESSAWLMNTTLSDTDRRTLLEQLFDPAAGIGLSVLRQPIGASDFSLSHYSYDDLPPGERDSDLTAFSIARDRAHVIPAVQQARSVNASILMMASPWSPPGWMKTTGSMIRGELRADSYAPYAAYLVKFLQAYAAEGIPIESITVQNEPLFTAEDYPGMYMPSADETRFIRDDLAPALAAAGLQPKVLAWDQNWNIPQYPADVLADAAARAAVAGSAFHCYAGDPAAMTPLHVAYPDKDVYVTECSSFASGTFGDSLIRAARSLVIGSMRNWARIAVAWNLALDEEHGPHTGGCVDCTGLATINRTTGAVTFNGDYYALGHASKFVRRGATRIESLSSSNGGVDHVAFRNPDGSFVLVVSSAWSDQTVRIRFGNESFLYSLPLGTVATFTWSGDPAGTVVPATAVPGSIQAENFDEGPEGVAYHDLTTWNSGGEYRNTGVDIEPSSDEGGGFNVGWMQDGEWLAYAIDVARAGLYTIDARVASDGPGGVFHIDVNGVDKTGPLRIPDTGGWQRWVTISRANVPLDAGPQRLRVVVDENGAYGDAGNLNHLRIASTGTSTPFNGVPAAIPGTVLARDFDEGGEGVAYHDLTTWNSGGQYRTTGVDIEPTTDTGGGFNVGWMQAGESLSYTVDVTRTGSYTLEARVASDGPGGTLHVEANGADVSGPIRIPDTSGWQSWVTVSGPIALTGGIQRVRVVVDANGAYGDAGNLNYLRFSIP